MSGVRFAQLALVLLSGFAPDLAAQTPSASAPAGADDAFLDADARDLHAKARVRWEVIDRSVLRYQAKVSQRLGVALRMPLRDRTLYRYETSSRVIWERDGGVAVQMLGAKVTVPFAERDVNARPRMFNTGFDPAGDPLLMGIGEWDDDEEMQWQHPLDTYAVEHYRFRTADTLVLSFPDGRTLRTVQLELIPRRDDPHLLSGALWIEPESGNLVRAVYRLARELNIETDVDLDDDDREGMGMVPGVFKPMTMDISMVAVDYSLWDLRVWMPRSFRAEGNMRAGVLSAPAVMEVAYEIEDVVTVADSGAALMGIETAMATLAGVAAGEAETTWAVDPGRSRDRGRRVQYLVPEDPAWLESSRHVPPPIWDDDLAFVRPEELEELASVLENLPSPVSVATMTTLDYAWQRPDLLRYNRIEALSVGARGAVRFGAPGGPLGASLTARLGVADWEPRGTLALMREGLERSWSLSAYRELQLVDPGSRALGFGNSFSALVFGRDDGDYWQATGAALAFAPPSADRAWWRVRGYAERQEAVERKTDASLPHLLGRDDGFRGVLAAQRADQLGAELTLAPWWGQDPESVGAGLELMLQGERGDFDFARARLGARALLPLPRGGRLALAAAGGATEGDAPTQRTWILGGPASLRGFAPATLLGPTFFSGRVELIAPIRSFRAARAMQLVFFTDGGWAGERDAIRWDAATASAGVGLSLLDGIVRIDWAKGWHGGSDQRVDLYLDGLL